MTPTTGAARLWAAIAASLGFFLVVTVAIGYSGNASELASSTSTTDPSAAAAAPQSFDVSETEFKIEPATINAAAGAPLTFNVSNDGQAEHDFTIDGADGTEVIPAGDATELVVDALEPGEYRLFCSLPGHADAGMEGTLTVAADAGAQTGGSGTEAGASEHAGMDHSAMTPEQMVKGHTEGVKAFPAETKGKGNQPLKFTEKDGYKVFEVTADEIDWEVAPGEVKEGMALNGQIPGPRIEVNQGDKVKLVVNNELDVPTAIHPHGLVIPNSQDGVPGITQDPIMPGESFTYDFTATNAGSNMYHSHFDSAKQVPSGLLGAFIVKRPNEPKVALDYTMILNDGPLGYTLNGKGFPATEPLVVKKGDLIRVRYMNEGLQIHPMHLHGMPQTVIAKDGWPLPQRHKEDTVLVAPGERVDGLIKATETGTWAYHCHILNHAEAADGMFGMVTALVVQ
jgi:manganese oxidase